MAEHVETSDNLAPAATAAGEDDRLLRNPRPMPVWRVHRVEAPPEIRDKAHQLERVERLLRSDRQS